MTPVSPSVQDVLDQRLRRPERRQLRRSFAVASGIHLAATLVLLVIPLLTAPARKPPHFVAIQLVPTGALGRPAGRAAIPPSPPPATPAARTREEARPAPTRAPAERPSPTAPASPKAPPQEASPAPAPPSVRSEPTSVAESQGSPSGSPGGTVFGAAVAGLDNPSFTYGYYLDQMLAQIQRQWVRPPLGSGIEALVSFRIQRDGRVTDLRIERSSGYSSFDLAGLRAVSAAAPLPPLPRGFSYPSLGVNLILK